MRIGYKPQRGRATIVETGDRKPLLEAMQELVGGYIEFFDPLWGDEPALVVNDNGVHDPYCTANLLIRATERMREVGFLSTLDFSHIVEVGEPYMLLFGDVLAVSYDEDGDARDITDEEFARFEGMCADCDVSDLSRSQIVDLLLE